MHYCSGPPMHFVSGVDTQGARLGNRSNAAEAAALGRKVQVEEAATFAANVLPIIESLAHVRRP